MTKTEVATWIRYRTIMENGQIVAAGHVPCDPAADPEVQVRVLRAFAKLNDVPVYRVETYAADILAGKFILQIKGSALMPHDRAEGAIHDGKPVTTIGDYLRVGHMPPHFELDLARSKEEKPGKITIFDVGPKFILLSVPSLDTPVCDEEAKRFGELSSEIPEYKILVVSMDLPFAMRRWLKDHPVPLLAASDHRTGAFGTAYGVLMKEPRLLMRAVFVFKDSYALHVEYVSDSATQVDFDAAIAAAKG